MLTSFCFGLNTTHQQSGCSSQHEREQTEWTVRSKMRIYFVVLFFTSVFLQTLTCFNHSDTWWIKKHGGSVQENITVTSVTNDPTWFWTAASCMKTQCWSDPTVRPDVQKRLHTFVRIKIKDKRRHWAVSHRRVFFDPETGFNLSSELPVIDPKVQIINKKCWTR